LSVGALLGLLFLSQAILPQRPLVSFLSREEEEEGYLDFYERGLVLIYHGYFSGSNKEKNPLLKLTLFSWEGLEF
jgi:hypothetical protein